MVGGFGLGRVHIMDSDGLFDNLLDLGFGSGLEFPNNIVQLCRAFLSHCPNHF